MSSLSPDQYDWLARPLLDAGLSPDQVRDLFFRLSFDTMMSAECGHATPDAAVVADQSARVRAAWQEVVGRMIALHPASQEGSTG